MIRILIVEDEKPISNLIRLSLTKAGYHCTCVYDGNAAVDKLDREIFDLILLDIMLPGANGFELMDYIRPLGIPVIFLTAVNSVNNRVRGLKMGAEDYIIKPFEIVELLSTNAGQVFDRERIYDTVWGLESDGNSDTIMEHIRKIRAKFSVLSLHTYIETVWGVGYKWVG